VNSKRTCEPTNASTQSLKYSSQSGADGGRPRKPQNSRNLIRRNILNNTARQKIEQDHVQCYNPQTIPADSKFLIDSSSDLNLIKLPSLRDEVMVDHLVYELKGITENFVTTLGSVTIELQIGGEGRSVEFQVVNSNFPVPNEGILGKPFIIRQETIINY